MLNAKVQLLHHLGYLLYKLIHLYSVSYLVIFIKEQWQFATADGFPF